MVNRPKIKGTMAETAVVEYLRKCGATQVERRALSGTLDKGDIAGIPGLVIEVKNEQKLNLAGWTAECRGEIANAGAEVGFVWAKKRGKGSPGDWYAVMTGDQMVELLRIAGYLPPHAQAENLGA